MTDHVEDDLTRTAHAWDQAMVGNDADAISRYMADDCGGRRHCQRDGILFPQ